MPAFQPQQFIDELPAELVAHSLGFLGSAGLARASQVSQTFARLSADALDHACRDAKIPTPVVKEWSAARTLHFVEARKRADEHRRRIAAGTNHCARVMPNGSLVLTDDRISELPTPCEIADAASALVADAVAAESAHAAPAAPVEGAEETCKSPAHMHTPAPAPPELALPCEPAAAGASREAVPVAAVAAGDGFTVLTTVDGECFAWGDGSDGALGLGHLESVHAPTALTALAGEHVVDVAAGFSHTMFVTASGTVYSAGWGHAGRLGHGDSASCPSLRPIEALRGRAHVVRASAGDDHSLLVDDAGAVWAFGCGADGQLGGGSEEARREAPARVRGALEGVHVVQAAAGERHSLFLASDGALYACGAGEHGRLGVGDEASRAEPARVRFAAAADGAEARIVACAAGHHHSVAIDDQGALWAWGDIPQGVPSALCGPDAAATLAPDATALAAASTTLAPTRWSVLPLSVRALAVSVGLEATLILGDDGECYRVVTPGHADDDESDEELGEGEDDLAALAGQ